MSAPLMSREGRAKFLLGALLAGLMFRRVERCAQREVTPFKSPPRGADGLFLKIEHTATYPAVGLRHPQLMAFCLPI